MLVRCETKNRTALRPQILEMSKKIETPAVQIGAEFSNQKKQFFLTKD